jgi:hypothetical protein
VLITNVEKVTLAVSVGQDGDGDAVVVDLDPEGFVVRRHRVQGKQVNPWGQF